MRVVIATHNRAKAAEMVTILGQLVPECEFLTLADFPGAEEPEETGVTYAENAAIKSEAAFRATGELSVSDDAGLEIDFFDGAPGVYSKRFGGEHLPFPEKIALILSRMEGQAIRGARFRCAVAITGAHGTEVFESTCEGFIATEPSGAHGFGYDPIFVVKSEGVTMATLSPERKNEVSHRGKVLRVVAPALRERLAVPQ